MAELLQSIIVFAADNEEHDGVVIIIIGDEYKTPS